jgi:hypothetical protein
MTVRELINRLLDEDMNAQVVAPVRRDGETEYAHVTDVMTALFEQNELPNGGREIFGKVHYTAYRAKGISAVVMLPAA